MIKTNAIHTLANLPYHLLAQIERFHFRSPKLWKVKVKPVVWGSLI
jgi:hypothetical protein